MSSLEVLQSSTTGRFKEGAITISRFLGGAREQSNETTQELVAKAKTVEKKSTVTIVECTLKVSAFYLGVS
jgi:hypothetical protein